MPELRGRVPRFKQLRVTALERNAEPLEIVASDFHARVIQHETDHLKGEVTWTGCRTCARSDSSRNGSATC